MERFKPISMKYIKESKRGKLVLELVGLQTVSLKFFLHPPGAASIKRILQLSVEPL